MTNNKKTNVKVGGEEKLISTKVVGFFEKNANESIKNERYDLYYKKGDNITTGITILNGNKETRGHSHDDVEEMYLFL